MVQTQTPTRFYTNGVEKDNEVSPGSFEEGVDVHGVDLDVEIGVEDGDISINSFVSAEVAFGSVRTDMENVTGSERCDYLKFAKTRSWTIFHIDKILNNVEEDQRYKLVMSSFGKIDGHMDKVLKAFFDYLKKLIRNGRRSLNAKIEGAQAIRKILGDSLDEVETQLWLADMLGLKERDELIHFLQYETAHPENPGKGRPRLSLDTRKEVYNYWKANSEVSVHRSNDRHILKLAKKNIPS